MYGILKSIQFADIHVKFPLHNVVRLDPCGRMAACWRRLTIRPLQGNSLQHVYMCYLDCCQLFYGRGGLLLCSDNFLSCRLLQKPDQVHD